MSKSPLELLAPDPDRIPRVIDKIWGPALGAVLGFGAVCFINFGTRRPILSGKLTYKFIYWNSIKLLITSWHTNILQYESCVFMPVIQDVTVFYCIGIQKHALTMAVGALVGQKLDNNRQEYMAERDAVLRHYIKLHPEDFPTPG